MACASANVAEILISNGRAHGVRLADGEEIPTGIVKRGCLPAEFMRWIDGYRTRGKSFKLLCVIDRLPRYKGFSSARTGVEYAAYSHIGPTPEFLERAFDEAKFGGYSSAPFLSPSIPT